MRVKFIAPMTCLFNVKLAARFTDEYGSFVIFLQKKRSYNINNRKNSKIEAEITIFLAFFAMQMKINFCAQNLGENEIKPRAKLNQTKP